MRHSVKGFTLVEVLVTVVVLTLGILGIHGGFSRSLHAIKTSETVLLSSFLMEDATAIPELQSWSPRKTGPSTEFSKSFEGFPGYELKAETKDLMLGRSRFDLYRIRIQGPADVGSEASLLLARSPDEAR